MSRASLDAVCLPVATCAQCGVGLSYAISYAIVVFLDKVWNLHLLFCHLLFCLPPIVSSPFLVMHRETA